ASVPDADDESATAADPAPPPSAPRSGENDFLPSASESALLLVGHASACVPLAGRSQPHLRSIARAGIVPADSQTNVCSHSPRCPPPPVPSVPRRKPALPRYAAAGVRPTRPFPCPTWLSLESSDENHSLYTSYAASFVSSASVISKSSLLETVGGRCRHLIKGRKRARAVISGRVAVRDLAFYRGKTLVRLHDGQRFAPRAIYRRNSASLMSESGNTR